MSEIRNLIDTLNRHTDEYNQGRPSISDEQWDDLYFALLQMEKETGEIYPDSPTQSIRPVEGELSVVFHTHHMASLDKTKSVAKVSSFLGNEPGICMGKMDGLTCTLRYKNGRLVAAETRGNGYTGQDVFNNACRVKGIPLKIDYKEPIEIDGEVICTFIDFSLVKETLKDKDYTSARAVAATGLTLKDPREVLQRRLTFIAWDWIGGPFKTLSDKLAGLKEFGFKTVPHIKCTSDDLEVTMKTIEDECLELGYPIDGLVFKYDDVQTYLDAGETAHHFKGGLAFKFRDEIKESFITDITWSLGRTGKITPVAIFEPVEIEGGTLTNASLHNVSVFKQLTGGSPRVGDEVGVYRANMIIPQIEEWNGGGEGEVLTIPTKCPVCSGTASVRIAPGSDVEVLWCDNPDCEGKLVNKITHYCDMKKGMAIKGLSKATIEKLIDLGWLTNIFDLYTLAQYRSEWIKLPGFGAKSVDNILNAIEKSKDCQLWQFISALGIPLIGETASRALEDYFATWATFYNSNKENFIYSTIPNFGEEMEKALQEFDLTIANDIATSYLRFEAPKEVDNSSELSGKTVVITGKLTQFKNRDELKQAIIANGGKVAGSVSAKTDYLLTNDTTSGSSKNVAAQKLGVAIISEKDFIEKFLT
jgi:DNA ligase (NAD+)